MKKLILLNLINWYVTSTSQWFLNRQDIAELCKVNFLLFIEFKIDKCCDHKTGVINIHLYGYVILLAPMCAVSLFVCMIANQSTSKKLRHMLDLR